MDDVMSVAYQVLEIDESKASAAAGVTVEDHLDLLEWPELLELCLELPLVGVEAHAEHAEALAGLRVISVTLMPPPDWLKVTMKASDWMMVIMMNAPLACWTSGSGSGRASVLRPGTPTLTST